MGFKARKDPRHGVYGWNGDAIMLNQATGDWPFTLLTVRGKDHDLDAKTLREMGEAFLESAAIIEETSGGKDDASL